jgi:hypothetical protein
MESNEFILNPKRSKGRPKTKPTRESKCFSINTSTQARIEWLADKKGVSQADIMNEALDAWLDVEEVPNIEVSTYRVGVEL